MISRKATDKNVLIYIKRYSVYVIPHVIAGAKFNF